MPPLLRLGCPLLKLTICDKSQCSDRDQRQASKRGADVQPLDLAFFWYPSGEGRRSSGLTVAFHGDHLDERLYTERGESQDLDLFSAIDPDDAIFGLHADGEIMEAIDRFAQFCRNAINGFDGVNLIQLHVQAA